MSVMPFVSTLYFPWSLMADCNGNNDSRYERALVYNRFFLFSKLRGRGYHGRHARDGNISIERKKREKIEEKERDMYMLREFMMEEKMKIIKN